MLVGELPVAQMFTTIAVYEDGEHSASFVSVPASRSRAWAGSSLAEITDTLGGTFLRALDSEQISEALSLVMTSPADAVALALDPSFGARAEPSLRELASTMAAEVLIPVEQSPLQFATLGQVVANSSGMQLGAIAALVGFWGTPILLIAVPGGIILGGAAEGIAKALNKGLRRRIERRLLGKR